VNESDRRLAKYSIEGITYKDLIRKDFYNYCILDAKRKQGNQTEVRVYLHDESYDKVTISQASP
jgi:hypothetical protein